ncbi:hypothetical protein Bbelb_184730 [Branchiostoma belcheri]|nr:hypothetical protein Bbelb_184730 [Branchiostoma belcheri]
MTTIDVKRNIFDLATDASDHYLALIEGRHLCGNDCAHLWPGCTWTSIRESYAPVVTVVMRTWANQGNMDSLSVESVCRLYEVGRLRVDGEDDEDEEQEPDQWNGCLKRDVVLAGSVKGRGYREICNLQLICCSCDDDLSDIDDDMLFALS